MSEKTNNETKWQGCVQLYSIEYHRYKECIYKPFKKLIAHYLQIFFLQVKLICTDKVHCCDILDRKVVKNGLFSAIFKIIKISLVTSFWSQQQENSTDKRPGYGSIGIPIQCRLALLLLQAIQQIVRKVQSGRTSYQRAQMYNLHVMYMYIDQFMYLSWDFRVFQDYIVKQFMTSKVNEFKVDLLSFYCSVLLSEVVRFVNYVNLPVR